MCFNCLVKEKRLGAGAFGVVYRARSKRSGKLYVIKEQHIDSPAVMNEVEVLRKIRPHPNVIAYHGSGHVNGKACIVMEYASRGSLDDIMKMRCAPISEEKAIYLFAQMVSGVNHIHRHSVIHRDLKPANVMIHLYENYLFSRDIVKIGDFGISKDTEVSIAKTAIGTKIYMAPETLEGRHYNSKCDMWSCGIILYELLTNSFPFEGRSVQEMMENIKWGRVTPITSWSISRSTVTMVDKLMSVDPDERPRSTWIVNRPEIAEINREVREFLNDWRLLTGGD